ncbi:MAG TPA: adenine phosphoribosyltransferase [Thermoanaerobaculia bacterium]|nr:adenine phosphoribosyltransferase [Thermoanaerobaculia bacterium]
MTPDELKTFIRDVPDFPKPGIMFKDITPLLRSPQALERSCALLAEPFRDSGVTIVAGIESRGFIFGSVVARNLGAGFVPIRKPGKLPWTTRRHEYVLEYGSDALEIHDDALQPGDTVLVIDDVLATGGTLAAATHLVRGFDATLAGAATVIELEFLDGRRKFDPAVKLHTVLRY